jgi:hypothetical protein
MSYICRKLPEAFLVVRIGSQTCVTSDSKLSNEESGKHREEVANVQCHDSQHTVFRQSLREGLV